MKSSDLLTVGLMAAIGYLLVKKMSTANAASLPPAGGGINPQAVPGSMAAGTGLSVAMPDQHLSIQPISFAPPNESINIDTPNPVVSDATTLWQFLSDEEGL